MKNLQLFVRKGQFSAGQGRKKKETNGQSAEIQLNRPPTPYCFQSRKKQIRQSAQNTEFFWRHNTCLKDYSIFRALPYLFSPGLETVWSGGLFSWISADCPFVSFFILPWLAGNCPFLTNNFTILHFKL